MKQVTKFYNAQTVLFICTEPDAAWTRQGDDFNIADIDATIVTSHMILAATEKDVASIWICRFWPEIARKEFHIPDNYRPVNILALGYTDDAWKSPERHDTEELRKPLSETVTYETF